jgi:hypothetical protein
MTKHKLLIPREITEIAIGEIPGLIAGVVEPYSRTDFSATRQAAIQNRHLDSIQKAIKAGELIGRNPLTKEKEPSATGKMVLGLVISIEELKEYVSQFGIVVKERPLPQESGRYTLEEATKAISEATGESERSILDLLVVSVQESKLLVYQPGSDVCYTPSIVREFYEEAIWDELNTWMDKYLPRIEWRFCSPENDDSNHQTIASMFGKEPNYQEWRRLIDKEYAPLNDAICYAIGRPLNLENRNNLSNWEEEVKEGAYSSLLNRADSDIISGTLKSKERNGKDFVSIRKFYFWVKQQGEGLNEEFLALEPVDNSFIGGQENEGHPNNLSITEKRERKLKTVIENMIDEGAFSPGDPRWPRTKIWERAVKDYPRLFPDDFNDQRDGVFAKAYNIVRRYFR